MDSSEVARIVGSDMTVSDKIRALDAAGYPRAEVARVLGKRYQHVRNVLEADKLSPKAAPAPGPENPRAGGLEEASSAYESVHRLKVEAGGLVRLPPEALAALQARPGSVVIAASLWLASFATSLLAFQLLFGLMVGGAIAAILAPMMATVTGWFDTHRSLAVSLVSAGMGMAPMTMAPLAAWLVSNHDWRTSMQILAAVIAAIMIPASLLVRRAPALDAPVAPGSGEAPPADISLTEAIRSPQFIILLATNFFCCATHSGPIIHTVSYAVSCGIPMIAAVTIYSVEGLAGMGGRLVFGLLGDRFGAKRVLVTGLLLQAFGALGYVFAQHLAEFYAAGALFGFIYAGTMPLYSVLVRENFPIKMLGTVIGGLSMAGSLGMATGPIAGGLIYDAFGSYAWLYIGSWAVGRDKQKRRPDCRTGEKEQRCR